MGIGTTRDELIALGDEAFRESLGVGDDLLGIGMVLGGGDLLHLHCDGSDLVVVGTTLATGEHGLRDLVLEITGVLSEEDDARARTAESLVGGGGNNISVVEGVVHQLGSDQAGEVGHVAHQDRANLIGDRAHGDVVPIASIGRAAADDELGAESLGGLAELDIVNEAGGGVDLVRERLEVDGGGGDLLGGGVEAVGEVTARGEIETHDAVVGLEETSVDLEVGGRSGVGLDVHTPLGGIQTKGLERARNAEVLNHVDVLVATIVTLAGVALGVLVREAGAKSLSDGTRSEVLWCTKRGV